MRGHSRAINSLAFSSDGLRIVSGSDDGTVRVWETHTGRAVSDPLAESDVRVTSVVYTPDGQFIISGTSNNTVQLHTAQTLKLVGEQVRSHSTSIRMIACSPDGRSFASAGDGGNIAICDLLHDHCPDALAYRKWWEACTRMKGDGWVRDEDGTLLLWVPVAYRVAFHSNARLLIDHGAPTIFPYLSDVETLLMLSGRNWTNVFTSSSSSVN